MLSWSAVIHSVPLTFPISKSARSERGRVAFELVLELALELYDVYPPTRQVSRNELGSADDAPVMLVTFGPPSRVV
jgi:hypothetical protein